MRLKVCRPILKEKLIWALISEQLTAKITADEIGLLISIVITLLPLEANIILFFTSLVKGIWSRIVHARK